MMTEKAHRHEPLPPCPEPERRRAPTAEPCQQTPATAPRRRPPSPEAAVDDDARAAARDDDDDEADDDGPSSRVVSAATTTVGAQSDDDSGAGTAAGASSPPHGAATTITDALERRFSSGPPSATTTLVVETLIEVEKNVVHILSAGFVSGMVVTAVLNPYDRALFLSVRAKRPFLARANWTTPFHGVWQTLVSRSLSTGLYFPLEELGERGAARVFGLDASSAATAAVAGNFAGACNALLLSPLAAVKYRSWGSIEAADATERRSVVAAALATHRRGGLVAFFTGFNATVARDMTFGCVFALARRQVRRALDATGLVPDGAATCGSSSSSTRSNATRGLSCFVADAAAAGAAAIVSGPLNYARNRQFAHISKDDVAMPSVRDCLAHFAGELARRPTLYAQAKYAQTRLMVGWGTLRVAAGMALSALCYDLLNKPS